MNSASGPRGAAINPGKWTVALVLMLLIAGTLVAYKLLDRRAESEQQAQTPEYSETVEAAKAREITYTPTVQVLGAVVAPQQLVLRNELAGRIAAVNFSSGEQVTQGQVLIQLDISEEQAQLDSARARAELARSTKNRIASLRRSDAVSQERYDQTIAELQVGEAEIARLQAIIEKKTLRAPFAAVTGIHQFEAGQYLEENTYITTLVGLQTYRWVDFTLAQFYPPLQTGTQVEVITVAAQRSSSTQTVTAAVIARDSTITSEARSQHYRARVDTAALALLPNAVVSVRVPVAPAEAKIAVPAIAVLHSSAGPYVYRLEPGAKQGDYRARQQPVALGDMVGELVIIEQGLQAGDMIAAAGAFKLSDGLLAHPATAVTRLTQPGNGAAP